MSVYKTIAKQILAFQDMLVSHGLVNYCGQTSQGDDCISFKCKDAWKSCVRGLDYQDAYRYFKENCLYNFSLADGALIQITYKFSRDDVAAHRLCYLPSPDLTPYQLDQSLYEEGEEVMFADISHKGILPVPVRFDYDPKNAVNVSHPATHLTLGQLPNCRIPVLSPLSPVAFLDFILRTFYPTWYKQNGQDKPKDELKMPVSITSDEKECVHISKGNN